MLAAERYDRIVEMVNVKGSMRVSELSERCRVTEETIRRDLDRLEHAGRLRRSHGGAVSVKEDQPEIPYRIRETTHAEEKKRIAQAALTMINPGDRILLDASTTAGYMAANMPDFPLTVLTNSIQIATELSNRDKVEVISTGASWHRARCLLLGRWRSVLWKRITWIKCSCRAKVYISKVAESVNPMNSRQG